jgi:hypothetical protein
MLLLHYGLRKSGQNEMYLKQHKERREKERREGEKTKEKKKEEMRRKSGENSGEHCNH